MHGRGGGRKGCGGLFDDDALPDAGTLAPRTWIFLGSLAPPWRRYESGGFHWKLAQNGELNGLFNG